MNQLALDTLLLAVVQDQDADMAQELLEEKGFRAIRLSSTGAFLGRQNVTLMIPVPSSEQHIAMNALKQSCRQRIEYIAAPIENAPFPIPTPTPIPVGGAIVFGFDLEHYEEI